MCKCQGSNYKLSIESYIKVIMSVLKNIFFLYKFCYLSLTYVVMMSITPIRLSLLIELLLNECLFEIVNI